MIKQQQLEMSINYYAIFMTKHLIVLVPLIVSALTVFGQDFNRPVPSGYPNYEFKQFGSSQTDVHYMLSHQFPSAQSNIRGLSIFDKDGYLAWHAGGEAGFYTNFEYHPQQGLFSYASNDNFENLMKFYLMDESFSIVDSLVPENNTITDIHEFRILANGNYLIVGSSASQIDLSGYVFDGNAGINPTTVKNFVIQEFENGSLVFDWVSVDHIHPEEFVDGYPYNPNGFDYVHGNAVHESADGNFLVSMRHTDAIYKINRLTGNMMWTLGGTSNQFNFTNDDGFSGQHDIRELPNGNITLFDNGNSKPAPQITRVVEYELDELNMTATRVWEYSDAYDSYSRAMGSFRSLSNGEKIVGFGFCYRPASNFIHLDAQDEIISELLFQDSAISYRAVMHPFPFELDKPEITCSYQNNETVLSAPIGYSDYKWSTGEETQQITVSGVDTVQVWVNQGIGMVGSEPFFLTDPTNPCGITGIDLARAGVNDDNLITFISNTGLFKSHENGTISVLNAMGQVIINKTVSAASVIDITAQPKGIYIIRFESDEASTFIKRFLKF
jgi:hypothetical protein